MYYENNSQKIRTQRTYSHMDFILVSLIFFLFLFFFVSVLVATGVCLSVFSKKIKYKKKKMLTSPQRTERTSQNTKKKNIKTPQSSEVTILFNIFFIQFFFLFFCEVVEVHNEKETRIM